MKQRKKHQSCKLRCKKKVICENPLNDEEQTSYLDEQQKLADFMMGNVKEFGKYSFELEEKREQSLINQSTQMVTAFSVFSIAIYTLLPVFQNIPIIPFFKLLFCVGIVTIFLLASLVLAVLVQWRFKYYTMKNIEEFYKSVNEEHENYTTQAQFDIQWKDQLKDIHLSKFKLNNRRVKLIKASMVLFFIAVGTVILSVIGIAFIMI
ncbi:MAG TPA: hypothetical protein DEQ02_01425 [Ruminococcaceae bacterium]|nr:hypothetical protein [Oscillospiraceae bacterium]